MDDILQYVFFEILGNIFFRIGRFILKVLTFGWVRLENPTRFQMFVVAMLGIVVTFPVVVLIIRLILGLNGR